MTKIDSINLDDEEENPRIDAIGNKIKVEKLLEESDYYEDYTPLSASKELDIWPKTAKKHMEDLREESTEIEKVYAGDIGLYRRTYCYEVCKMENKADEECDEENEDACREKETLGKIEEDLNCSCQVSLESHRNETIDATKMRYSA